MILDLTFWARDRDGARLLALEWADAEPNVAAIDVLDVQETRPDRWSIRVRLAFRETAQQTLGLEVA